MAIEKGSFGVVNAGGTAVGFLLSYQFDERARLEETTVAGASGDDASWSPTRFESSGQCTAYEDESDAGQTALAAGATVTLLMQPQGAGTGLPQRSVTATVESVSEPLAADAYLQVTFSWRGGKVDRAAQT